MGKLCYCGYTPAGFFIQCELHKELEKWREREDEIKEMDRQLTFRGKGI